ncbi:MAG: GcvT family protein [Deltaproteobacteria bacterium]|jgi:4-methylaminobutanoate oxidase (formaldehyde-forming)|nr:GcvT family protein [Deltaproteobacteria bacterium]MBW2537770.1 GcvT family protein [Deltaproteobacteria bacterium]
MSASDFPTSSRVVIVGGGIIGCSLAYHLGHLGWTDVVLLERDKLTSGTTWHAAGLMTTFGSTSETSVEMRTYTRELYDRLEEETEQATGFERVGFIELAADADRLEEYRRVAAFNRYCGNDVEEISPAEIKELFPLAKVDDILAGFYLKQDGRVNPVDATMALAKGARQKGVRIIQDVSALGVTTAGGRVTGVVTDRGTIQCEFVVNCAGMWAREFGARAGVAIPNQAAEHYYLITGPIDGISRQFPIIEDPSSHGYYREEHGGLMIGLFEPVCAPWAVDGIPPNFSFGEITPDWERMTPFLEKAMSRVPVSMETGIKKFFCGPESFTPDMGPAFGEAPELENYFVAAGLNSIGIITGGGMGRILAQWITTGDPGADITPLNVDRFHPYQCNPEYLKRRVVETLGLVYRCHYPTRSPQTARNAKRSPFHERLAAAGAYFQDVSGWESPGWYAPEGHEPKVDKLSWGRQNWFPWWEAEHRACSEGVIAMDMTFMSKFLVEGRDAGTVLDHISANSVNGPTETITYTQWLNERGTIEADVTVIKQTEERFIVVATDTMHRHVETWLRRHIPADAHCFATDITATVGQLNLQGPRSRELLQTLTTADLSTEAFPFRTSRVIDIGYSRVLCNRITYVGELGYELCIPAEQAVHVYDLVVEAGEAFGLRHAGLRALGSLRMEKAYRDYGHDIDNTDDPFEVGLGFFVDLKSPVDFIGKAPSVAKKALGPTFPRRLLQILVKDPEPLLYHGEVIHRDGKPVGYNRVGSYGFTIGGAVGLAMIDAGEPINKAYMKEAHWEVDVAGKRYPLEVKLPGRPFYDPKLERVRI